MSVLDFLLIVKRVYRLRLHPPCLRQGNRDSAVVTGLCRSPGIAGCLSLSHSRRKPLCFLCIRPRRQVGLPTIPCNMDASCMAQCKRSVQSFPCGRSGIPIVTCSLPRRGNHCSARRMERVPCTAIGTTGTGLRCHNKGPHTERLQAWHVVKRPFRKDHEGAALLHRLYEALDVVSAALCPSKRSTNSAPSR